MFFASQGFHICVCNVMYTVHYIYIMWEYFTEIHFSNLAEVCVGQGRLAEQEEESVSWCYHAVVSGEGQHC